MRIKLSVQKLTPYTPGEQPKSRSVIKLNTNENPYLPSPLVARTLKGFNLDNLRRYPDPVFMELRERIAALNGTTPEHVFVGNGSDELLALATRAFVEDDGVIGAFNPSYSLYRTLAAIRTVKFHATELPNDFSWTEPQADGVSLFLLTNPNAPTSIRYPDEAVAAFAKSFLGVVLIDEAYTDFSGATCMGLATAPDNESTLVMRTLSKSFSLAGLRLGYLVGPVDLIGAMYKIKDSYNVDALAQAVALAALNDLPWMRKNVAKIVDQRDKTAAELRRRGWDVPESSSNFLFARPAHRPAAEIFEALKKREIFVRYFPGPRTGDRLRITIGTESDMISLLDALVELDK